MFAQPDLLLIGAGILVSVLCASLVDLWLIAVSVGALFGHNRAWGAAGLMLGLVILGGIVGFAGLLYRVLLDVQG